MKALAQFFVGSPEAARPGIAVFLDLIKARLTFLVLLTSFVGFYLGSPGRLDFWLLFHAMAATALLASGAASLNQYLERDHDARMTRTAGRPLPAGHMKAETVLLIGGLMCLTGLVYLAQAVNFLTGVLGALTLFTYLFVYTPLKRITTLNTAIGAIPGALPPLMGWTAASGEFTAQGWSLFAILFFWQLPHFLAIAWIYRDQYASAGFKMLPLEDPEGARTSRQALSHAMGLLPISMMPFFLGMTHMIYLAGAFVLGAGFVWVAVRFARELSVPSARRMFFYSILYLPLLLGLMVLTSIKN